MIFVQIIPTFFGVFRTQVDTIVLSSRWEEVGLSVVRTPQNKSINIQ